MRNLTRMLDRHETPEGWLLRDADLCPLCRIGQRTHADSVCERCADAAAGPFPFPICA